MLLQTGDNYVRIENLMQVSLLLNNPDITVKTDLYFDGAVERAKLDR